MKINSSNIKCNINNSYIDKADIDATDINGTNLSSSIVKRIKIAGGKKLVVIPRWTCIEKYQLDGNEVYLMENDEEAIKFLSGEIKGKNSYIWDSSESVTE